MDRENLAQRPAKETTFKQMPPEKGLLSDHI